MKIVITTDDDKNFSGKDPEIEVNKLQVSEALAKMDKSHELIQKLTEERDHYKNLGREAVNKAQQIVADLAKAQAKLAEKDQHIAADLIKAQSQNEELQRELEASRHFATELNKKHEELQHAYQALQLQATTTVAKRRAWHYPKRGDMVRCIKLPEVPNDDGYFKVNAGYEVAAISSVAIGIGDWKEVSAPGIVVTRANEDKTFTDFFVPLECFEQI